MSAAVRLFAARGYDDVTVADVCTDAKVSKRYFYHYFSDRGELLLALHRELFHWLMHGITESPSGVESVPAVAPTACGRGVFNR